MNVLIEQRKNLNYRKKKRRPLYKALSDEASLAAAARLYESGDPAFREEYEKYNKAKNKLDRCGVSREELAAEKAAVYKEAADLNREIRRCRKDLKMFLEIWDRTPEIEDQVNWIDQLDRPRGRTRLEER